MYWNFNILVILSSFNATAFLTSTHRVSSKVTDNSEFVDLIKDDSKAASSSSLVPIRMGDQNVVKITRYSTWSDVSYVYLEELD